MKRRLITITCFLLLGFFAQAQEGLKLAKAAGRALTSYNLDPASNQSKLDEAISKIDDAIKESDAQAVASTWITRGDIYNARLQKDMAMRMVDTSARFRGDNDALVAYEAYAKGYEMAEKKFQKKDAAKGIAAVQGHMVNIGAMKYEIGQYDKAYASWLASMESHKILAEAGEASLFDDAAQMEEQKYYTGIAAQMAGKTTEAIKIFSELKNAGTDRAGVYDALFNMQKDAGNTEDAEKTLAEGRAKFPNDSGLLFAEINMYLEKGKLNELTDRLKEAIKKEPENIGLYLTTGNVYDNLFQKELEAGNIEVAEGHFQEALNYYNQASEKDSKSADAIYSIGALYYNKAAFRTQELQKMENDFSPAGLKKAKEKRDQVMALFDQALPFFQKAESINPNELNTLIALSEIYARKEDFTKMKEFKARQDVVKDGGKNPNSYFKL
jgi:tetratricopeptide (TPR) repeat protein